MNSSLSKEQKEQAFSNLWHKRVYKRIQAVRDIADIVDKRVIPSLIERLSDAGRSGSDNIERVCDVAAEILEQLDDPETNEVVNAWYADPFPFFKKALDWNDDQYEIAALRELSKLDGDRVVEALMYAMGGYSQNAYEIARDEIIQRGKKAIPRLIQYLDDDNEFQRKYAAYLLGKIGDTSVVPKLISACHDPEARVRCSAVEALGVLGDELAIESIERRLYDTVPCDLNFPERVCDIAAKSLQRLGSPKAMRTVEEWHSLGVTAKLVKALRSDDLYVLQEAVWSAGRLKVKGAVEPLLDILNNDDPEIKRGVIWSLSVLRDPRVISYLLSYANDENPVIVNAVHDALERLGHRAE